ncbi:hypothetical protein [Novosphingobium sp. JCM 18896]|uniref:hypothetical protein n=1 Tax=Novosphingobium sp. JCM 18896 TaxID=2989731 RepID=UPI0022218BD6|nr:hypothetical protein [Novosphingobium sp. JCM 18896]MCW1431381.1 hypothetical protein [Novosphingobium sp. JCM 18896]
MSRWFRHYAGMMRDEKLVRVAIKSKQPVERVLWIWGAILESAAEIDEHGRYDLDAAEVAYFLRADEADVDAVLVALADAGRVAEGSVVKWGDRQFSSDRSKERVAAHRQRKRSSQDTGNGEQRDGNDGVTLQERHRNSPETETETYIPLANANGRDVIDPEKVMFDSGVALITSCGKSESQARSWLGKAKRDHGAELVITMIGRAKREGAPDPIAFMEGGFRAKARASPAPVVGL